MEHIPSWEAKDCSASKGIPAFIGSKGRYFVHERPVLVCVLSRARFTESSSGYGATTGLLHAPAVWTEFVCIQFIYNKVTMNTEEVVVAGIKFTELLTTCCKVSFIVNIIVSYWFHKRETSNPVVGYNKLFPTWIAVISIQLSVPSFILFLIYLFYKKK
jgi:hypothetical protein